MTQKNNNTSMFLYTALIFAVALVLIIISFFGQTNLERSQPKIESAFPPESEHLTSSISQKAAELSEENMILIEKNKELEVENEDLKEKIKNDNLILTAYIFMQANDKENAKTEFEKINSDYLTDKQTEIYNKIKEFTEK